MPNYGNSGINYIPNIEKRFAIGDKVEVRVIGGDLQDNYLVVQRATIENPPRRVLLKAGMYYVVTPDKKAGGVFPAKCMVLASKLGKHGRR